MYTEPTTNIRLLANVPLDREHANTIYFRTLASQTRYFTTKAVLSLTQNTYQRINKGIARVEGKADVLYKCNYMMFQNAAHGDKWFYAFITSVEYINESTSEITFEIDNIQTWLFEMSLGHCMIERCHTPTDVIGANLEPENVDIGEYKTTATQTTGYFNKYAMVIFTTEKLPATNPDYKAVSGGLPMGLYAYAYLPQDEDDYKVPFNLLNSAIENYGDVVVSVFLFPQDLLDLQESYVSVDPTAVKKEVKPTTTIRPTSFDGYVPKNNKLFTFPYTLLKVSTTDGKSITTRYEWFNDDTPDFELLAGFSANPSVLLVPHNYGGCLYSWDNALEITQFPQVAFAIDTYRAWVAQGGLITLGSNAVTSNLQALGSAAISTIATPALTPVVAARGTLSQASTTISNIAEIAKMKNMPDSSRGSCSATAPFCHRLLNFYFEVRQVRREYAEIIDEYFTKYGYAYNKIGIPNLMARPHYTYIKTADAIVTGSIPAEASSDIRTALNSGITFWLRGDEIGNYSVDNSPK